MPRIFDVIEYLDPSGRELVHRIPEVGSGDFRLGSQLIVRESQVAVFFRDGKALDTFGAGRHTLSTANIPLLGKLRPLKASPGRSFLQFAKSFSLRFVPDCRARPYLLGTLAVWRKQVASLAQPGKQTTRSDGSKR